MASDFPTSIQDLDATRGTAGDPLDTPNHVTHHALEDDTVEALQAKVGVDSSAVTTSHDYKLSKVTGSDYAIGRGDTSTLSNKTLTAPVINVNSDATGDMYYRNGSGIFTRLAIGSASQIIQVSAGGLPEWIANPAATDASATVKGVVEIATSAELSAGTSAGGTSALLVVPASLVGAPGAWTIAQFDASGNYPAADGSALTNIANTVTYVNGQTTKNAADASATQNIAHGLGAIPKKARITMRSQTNTNWNYAECTYNGTTDSYISYYGHPNSMVASTIDLSISTTASSSGVSAGVVTMDATNIIITWTKTSSPTGTYLLLWEAEG